MDVRNGVNRFKLLSCDLTAFALLALLLNFLVRVNIP